MPFSRCPTAALPRPWQMDYQRAALSVLAASVGGLYALAVIQFAVPGHGTTSPGTAFLEESGPLATPHAPEPAKAAPAQLARTAHALPKAKPQANKLAGAGNSAIDLDAVRAGDGAVPRLAAARLPEDLPVVQDVAARKASFFNAVLPLILLVNEEISAERQRLTDIHQQFRSGASVNPGEEAWLSRLAAKYQTDGSDFAALFLRVDTVSPALSLAQAAEESGWGRSRFAQEGNALFGQRTWVRGAGIVPAGRSAHETYEVRAFTTLIESVSAYALNLNTHRSYAGLRELRAAMREESGDLDAVVLASALTRYSERGPVYVDNLRAIIRANRLTGFENAKLVPSQGLNPTQIANRPAR